MKRFISSSHHNPFAIGTEKFTEKRNQTGCKE